MCTLAHTGEKDLNQSLYTHTLTYSPLLRCLSFTLYVTLNKSIVWLPKSQKLTNSDWR